MNFHAGTFVVHIRLLAKFAFPAQTPNEGRLKLGWINVFDIFPEHLILKHN